MMRVYKKQTVLVKSQKSVIELSFPMKSERYLSVKPTTGNNTANSEQNNCRIYYFHEVLMLKIGSLKNALKM